MNNTEFVQFVEEKIGTAYVYGMKGRVMTQTDYNSLKNMYGDMVWDSDRNKIGQVCVDCSGLISWATGIIRNSQGYYNTAVAVHPISTIAKAPIGAAVWQKGHIGIYAGNGEYIAADGSAYGVRRNKVANARFTHWLILKDITYVTQQGDDEVVEKSKMIVEGQELPVERILKDGKNYIRISDLAEIMGLEVGHDKDIATLNAEESTLVIDQKEISVSRILLAGKNYIRSTDLAEALEYDVDHQGNIAVLKKKA